MEKIRYNNKCPIPLCKGFIFCQLGNISNTWKKVCTNCDFTRWKENERKQQVKIEFEERRNEVSPKLP